jgi:hypothetical protein
MSSFMFNPFGLSLADGIHSVRTTTGMEVMTIHALAQQEQENREGEHQSNFSNFTPRRLLLLSRTDIRVRFHENLQIASSWSRPKNETKHDKSVRRRQGWPIWKLVERSKNRAGPAPRA